MAESMSLGGIYAVKSTKSRVFSKPCKCDSIHSYAFYSNLLNSISIRFVLTLTTSLRQSLAIPFCKIFHAARARPWLSVGDNGAFANARVIPAISSA